MHELLYLYKYSLMCWFLPWSLIEIINHCSTYRNQYISRILFRHQGINALKYKNHKKNCQNIFKIILFSINTVKLLYNCPVCSQTNLIKQGNHIERTYTAKDYIDYSKVIQIVPYTIYLIIIILLCQLR